MSRTPSDKFVLGLETECLTSCQNSARVDQGSALEIFTSKFRDLAPSLTTSGGFFNSYGRVYFDCGHLELASSEVHCPFLLASVVERQQRLAREAAQWLEEREGVHLVLANNNHSGILQDGCPFWGAHENYFVEEPPATFGEAMLAFLVTRLQGGSGSIRYPSGQFVAGVRSFAMEVPMGGGTTECRAVHSTARDESHMGTLPGHRYHLILGDGHRNHYNLALQFGTTALATKIVADPELWKKLDPLNRRLSSIGWMECLRQFNVLAQPGEEWQVNPLVIEVQEVYLEAARSYAGKLPKPPSWVPRILEAWQEMIDAWRRRDLEWLLTRFDAFTKFAFFTEVLAQEGLSWETLPENPGFFSELTLLDQGYHEFSNADSLFDQFERDGLVDHRVGPVVGPGEEPEPYIPETTTRAAVRARFIRDLGKERGHCRADWVGLHDGKKRQFATLYDPFTQEVEWQDYPKAPRSASTASRLRERLGLL